MRSEEGTRRLVLFSRLVGFMLLAGLFAQLVRIVLR